MAVQFDPDDTKAVMREIMGFSTFTTSGSKGGRSNNNQQKATAPSPSQPHLTGANQEPLSKRLKPSNAPTSTTTFSTSMTDSRPKSTSPPPYIPPNLYPAHILPLKPTAAAMLNIPDPEPSPAHSTNSDVGPFRGMSAGPTLHHSQPQIPSGNPLISPLPAPGSGSGPKMTTYNAFTASQSQSQPAAPGTTTTPASTFISQDVRFAPPPASLAIADPAPGIEPPEPIPAPDPREKQYARDGVSYMQVNERGDTVFFKPSFVVDDPWEALRGWSAERREKKKGKGWGKGYKGR